VVASPCVDYHRVHSDPKNWELRISARGLVYTLRRIKNDRCRLWCLSKIAHMPGFGL
jgi:hypothetical protein